MQYSQVEQAIQQKAILQDILGKVSEGDLTRAAQLIGQTAEFDSSVAGFSAGSPAEWRWNLPSAPGTIEAEILNSSGAIVARPAVPAGASASFRWDGTLAAGGRAPDGAYVLRLIPKAADGSVMTPDLTSVGQVREIVRREGELWAGIVGAALPIGKLVRVGG